MSQGGNMDEIYKRRSYHGGFDGTTKISDGDINAILKAGMNAPSGMDEQPWEFVVIDNRKTLEQLSSVKDSGGTRACATASHVIVICQQPDKRDFAKINTGITAENMTIEAAHLGIGSLIMGIHSDESVQAAIKNILSIPTDFTAYLMVAFGYPTETLPPNNRWLPERIHNNKF
jgi:nitroreductase